MKVTDPSQKWKILIALVAFGYFAWRLEVVIQILRYILIATINK
jgi:hypothetical protein